MKKFIMSGLITTSLLMGGVAVTEAAQSTYTVKNGDNLTKISKQYGVTISEIKKENALKSDTIRIGQVLKIPTKNATEQKPTVTTPQTTEKEKIYTIKKGDTLNKIAKNHNTSVKLIKERNGMKNDNIAAGKTLIIPVKNASTQKPTETKPNETKPTETKPVENKPTENKPTETNKQTTHTVKKGDNLSSIARTNGVTVANIKKWNELKGDTIYIGQKLIIKKGETTTKPTDEIKENQKFDPKPSTLKRVNPKTVKGIYVAGAVMNNKQRYSDLIALVNRTELNAVVMDVKMDSGDVVYQTKSPIGVQYKTGTNYVKDMPERLKKLKDDNIYTIARVVAFKDTKLSKQKTSWAIKRKDGTLYKDGNNTWLNPYNKETWVYILDLAKEAASIGYDEIQFDYVRFPTNGDAMDKVVNYGKTDGKSKEQIIAEFLRYAEKELKPFNVKVSADIFGIATGAPDDSGIGHDWSTLTQAVEIMSPMMYPSHYGAGVYNIKNPNANPYETIKKGLEAAIKKDNKLKEKGIKTAVIRPWLQDFSQHGITYGPKQVKDQIKAAKELGVDSYLLWNASNKYTEGALAKENKN